MDQSVTLDPRHVPAMIDGEYIPVHAFLLTFRVGPMTFEQSIASVDMWNAQKYARYTVDSVEEGEGAQADDVRIRRAYRCEGCGRMIACLDQPTHMDTEHA